MKLIISVLLLFVLSCFLPNLVLATVPQSIPGYVDSGWDPGIMHKCFHSYDNKFSDVSGCTGNGKSWQIGYEGETLFDSNGIAICNQNFDLLNQNSFLWTSWFPQQDGSFDVQFFTDLVHNTHPCGGNNFNWIVLQEVNGTTYPKPDKLFLKTKINYQMFKVDPASGARVIAAWQGFWDGKVHEIELTLNPQDWGDANPDPRVIVLIDDPTTNLDYVHGDGAYYGYQIASGEEKEFMIDWGHVIKDMVAAGFLDTPTNWDTTQTWATWVGIETFNSKPTNAIITNLQIKDFRVLSQGTPLKEDLNKDGKVDGADFTLFMSKFGQSDPVADINQDGLVNIFDFNLLVRNFGQ